MTIPKHVMRITEKVVEELEFELLNGGDSKRILNCIDNINKLQEEIKSRSGELFKDTDKYINAINIMSAIFNTIDYSILSSGTIERIFHEDIIEPSLLLAINGLATNSIDSDVLEEVDTISNFIELSPNVALCQEDLYSKFRVFKLVHSKEKWYEIKRSLSCSNLLPEFRHVKVCYTTSKTYSNFSKEDINIAKNHLIQKLGINGFKKIRKQFETYFQTGIAGTYYIYIPTP